MEQHPIPQQISSYEFKLVGEMTLKQFFMVGGGLAIAFLINSTKMVFLIRYPLMAIFGGGGAILAFLPIGGRPAAAWLMAFIKSIYSPTIYTYKKGGGQNWMEWQAKGETEEVVGQVRPTESAMIKRKKGNKVKDFIHSLPTSRKGQTKDESAVKKEVEAEEDKTETQAGVGVVETEKKGKMNEVKTVEDWREKQVILDLKRERLGATGEAVFGSIPMPSIPEVPNLTVGMVTSPEGKIVEDAIVEIQDEQQGYPVRVLKTNSLGQFKTSTQLANGKYLVITEKKGQGFDRVNIELVGRIVEPIKIQAIA